MPGGPLGEPPAPHDSDWHLARADQLLALADGLESVASVSVLLERAHAHRKLAKTMQEIVMMRMPPPWLPPATGTTSAGRGGGGGRGY